jgi:hypothetical protein
VTLPHRIRDGDAAGRLAARAHAPVASRPIVIPQAYEHKRFGAVSREGREDARSQRAQARDARTAEAGSPTEQATA